MTGTIDASPDRESAEPYRRLAAAGPASPALIEQAKGVLIFRYGIPAEAAQSLLELWAAETDSDVDQVAHAVIHEICQGDRSVPSEPALVRWLEDRLRREFPGVECEGSDTAGS